MVNFKFFQKKYYTIIISPVKVSCLVLTFLKDSIIPVAKYEENAQIFSEGEINKEILSQSLINIKKLLKIHNQEIQAFIILNLPILFAQRFLFYPYETISLREAIENKIKQTIPINLNKYLWEYSMSPLQKNYVYVTFYNKENLQDITYALLKAKILPVKITHILHSAFDFIRNNFSLYYENSYQIYVIHQNMLTSGLYENAMLRNIYSESLTTNNLKDVLKRLIQNNLKDSHLPLDIIYIISDNELELDEEIKSKFKVLNIKEVTHFTPDEIASINIVGNFLFKKESSLYELKIVNLDKEILFLEFTKSLKLLSLVSLIFLLIINSGIFTITKILENSNKKIKSMQFSETTKEIFSIEEINQLKSALNQLNSAREKYVDKIEKIYYNLKDFNISQGLFTKDSAKLIIEVQDLNQREEIKKKIQQLYPSAQINLLFNGLEINLNNY